MGRFRTGRLKEAAMVLLDVLEDLDFLHGLSREHLSQVAGLGQLQEHPAGAVLFREGEVSRTVSLVTGTAPCPAGVRARRIGRSSRGR
jgi:hypothetical protein